MTQKLVIQKLAVFLDYEKKKNLAQLEHEKKNPPKEIAGQPEELKKYVALKIKQQKESEAYSDSLIQQLLHSPGYCFGFSVAHAVKGTGTLLDWWEQLLVDIATWDENPASLNQRFLNARRGDLFTYAAHSILFSQATYPLCSELFEDISQQKFLDPKGHTLHLPVSSIDPIAYPSLTLQQSYLEVIDKDAKAGDKPKTIQSTYIMSGNLTEKQLHQDLREDLLRDSMIFVSDTTHTIQIACLGSNWMVYNPSNDHSKKAEIHEVMTKSACIRKLFQILGPAFSLLFASYDKNVKFNFPAYEQLVTESPCFLIADDSFSLIAREAPHILAHILKQIKPQEKYQLLQIIANGLINQDENQWAGLHVIARRSPLVLKQLLDLSDTSPEGILLLAAICKALPLQNDDQNTALMIISFAAPQTFLKLLDLVHHPLMGPQLLKRISQALPIQNKFGGTALHAITMFCPEVLFRLFDLISYPVSGEELLSAITQALPKQTLAKETALELIATDCPSALFGLLELTNHPRQGLKLRDAIRQALPMQNQKKQTVLNTITKVAAEPLPSVFRLIAASTNTEKIQLVFAAAAELKNKDGLDKLLQLLAAPYSSNQCFWQYLCKYPISYKEPILELIQKHIETMSDANLDQYGREIRQALYANDARYRGLRNPSSFFGRRYLGDELKELWQTLLQMIQKASQAQLHHNPAQIDQSRRQHA